MATPHVSTNFADALDIRFHDIFDEEYEQHEDMIPMLYTDASNGRNDIRWSQTGTVPNFSSFTGTVDYKSFTQGYDTVATPVEFTNGIQIERKLLDDDQYHIMDGRPLGLATSAARTRQTHAAAPFVGAFSNASTFYVNSEAVALCSNSHTTTSGASTAAGFDNLVTSALSATAVAAARIQFRDFRGDQAERIRCIPDQIMHPPNLYEEAYEIINSSGKVDGDLNNANVHHGQYTSIDWEYLSDANDWFMMDSRARRRMLYWTDRIPLEFAFIEDFDTLTGKWRAYMRYAHAHTDWRWILGAQVS